MKNTLLLSIVLLSSSIYANEPLNAQIPNESQELNQAKETLEKKIQKWIDSYYSIDTTPEFLYSQDITNALTEKLNESNFTVLLNGQWAEALIKQEAESTNSPLAQSFGKTISLKDLQEKAVLAPTEKLTDEASKINTTLRNNALVIAAKIGLAIYKDKIHKEEMPKGKKAIISSFLRTIVDIKLKDTIISSLPKTSFDPVVEFATEQTIEHAINPLLKKQLENTPFTPNKLISTIVKLSYAAYKALVKYNTDSNALATKKASEEARINNNAAIINYLLVNATTNKTKNS